VQSNGIRQGPSSPLNFNVLISDANTVFEKYPDLDVTFFADDGTISSPKLDTLQAALTESGSIPRGERVEHKRE
jgi:hypothetical protein